MKIPERNRIREWSRNRKRILLHHLPLLLISVFSVGLFYRAVELKDVIHRLSMATAYPGIVLLAATLVIGPLAKMFYHSNPISTDFRRDLGFWAAIVSLVHVVFGLQVHMRGRMWTLFLRENLDFPFIRFDLFGAANYTGLIATLVLVMLLAASNDWSLQFLGWEKWKRLQRWNYVLFPIVFLHGVLYQVIEKRVPPFIYIFAGIGAIIVIVRVAGSFYQKQNRG